MPAARMMSNVKDALGCSALAINITTARAFDGMLASTTCH